MSFIILTKSIRIAIFLILLSMTKTNISGCSTDCSFTKCDSSREECLSKCSDDECKSSCSAEYYICFETRKTSCKMCITYCFYCENNCEDYECKTQCDEENIKCLDNNIIYFSKNLK